MSDRGAGATLWIMAGNRNIRLLTKAQADAMAERISRDSGFYKRVTWRLAQIHVRDNETHAAIMAAGRVEQALIDLHWAWRSAARGPTPEQLQFITWIEPTCGEAWVGDGI